MQSVRVREAIKTGLAMVVALGIALRMDFLNPYWAGFAVAFISLDTAGQSLNKGVLRMLGTLVGLVVSLTLAAWFPQERWGMMLGLTPWIGLCAYMIAGKRRQYFWFVSAFVVIIVMIKSGGTSLDLFREAVARVEETALGIGVYALVSVFLWPRTSRDALEASVRQMLDVQLALFQAYRGLLAGRGRLEDSRPLRLQADQALQQLDAMLAAAETDTYAVWEVRHAWRSVVRQSTELLYAFGRWRTGMPEVQELDLARVLPGLEPVLAGLEARIVRIRGALDGDDDGAEPGAIDLSPDPNAELSLFERAAVVQLATQLRRIDEASRALLDAVRDIRGSGRVATPAVAPVRRLSLDPDRLRAAAGVIASMWAGFCLWVWVDPPGHAGFWFGATLFALLGVLARVSPALLVPGLLIGIAVGGIAYVLVMPHLSGFAELGLMIFVVVAGLGYLLHGPRLGGLRTACFGMFLLTIALDNRNQSYSFAHYANASLAYLLAIGLAAAVAYLPSSPRPEKVFLRLLSRYFRQAEILMGQLAPNPGPQGLVERARRVFYKEDLLEIPAKLAALMDRVDCRLLPGTTPEQVRALVMNLGTLTMRIHELLEARQHVEPDPRLEEVVTELREWRLLVQRQFRQWAADPAAALQPEADLSERLHARLGRIEAGLEAARARAGGEGLIVDYPALYRYLGGFRGLSETAIGYAAVANSLAWEPWREARF